jgi:uncharacterized protein (UPF0332 family)
VKAETSQFLEKARDDLADARKIATIGLAKIVARSAYYAAFHASEAYIFERTGRIVKTHSGVRSELARLVKGLPGGERALTSFLAKAYVYKEISDYGVGAGAVTSETAANEAVEAAGDFIDRIEFLLTS